MNATADEAAMAASFHPRKAATRIGSRRSDDFVSPMSSLSGAMLTVRGWNWADTGSTTLTT